MTLAQFLGELAHGLYSHLGPLHIPRAVYVSDVATGGEGIRPAYDLWVNSVKYGDRRIGRLQIDWPDGTDLVHGIEPDDSAPYRLVLIVNETLDTLPGER